MSYSIVCLVPTQDYHRCKDDLVCKTGAFVEFLGVGLGVCAPLISCKSGTLDMDSRPY